MRGPCPWRPSRVGGRNPTVRETTAKVYRAIHSVMRVPRSERKNAGVVHVVRQPISLLAVRAQGLLRRGVDRDQPRLPKFRATNQEHAGLKVDIGSIEMERFVDPQAGHRQQAKQRGIGPPPEVLGRRQGGGALDQRDDILIAIALRRLPPVPLADQVGGRHFRARVGGAAPDGEASRNDQSPSPRAGLSARRLQRPLAYQIGGDERTAGFVHERHEVVQKARHGAGRHAQACGGSRDTA